MCKDKHFARIINGLGGVFVKTERNNGAENEKTERNNGVENVKTERNGGISALLEALGYLTPIAPLLPLFGLPCLGEENFWGELLLGVK